MDNKQSINEGLRELALFAGAGGGILGGKLLGWKTVCAVEWEPYPAAVLCARQNDGLLPPFPIWDDVQTFDGRPWRGIDDVVSGGFPCQDISAAGKGAGIDGERSGMWKHMARIICEVRPRYAFIENSPMLTVRGLDRVLCDLAAMGFDAAWGVLGAADVGANHQRDRIWIVARWNNDISHAEHNRFGRGKQFTQSAEEADGEVAYAGSVNVQRFKPEQFDQEKREEPRERQAGSCGDGSQWWSVEPNVGRVADGVAARVDRLKAIGNGQVPLCAAIAWNTLLGELT